MLVAGAAALTAGCTGSPQDRERADRSRTPRPEEAAIFDLSFATTARFRPFELLAPGFSSVDLGPRDADGLERGEAGTIAPYAAVVVRVEDVGPGAELVAGLATADEEESVLVRWSASRRRVTIEVRVAGRTHVVRRRKAGLTAGDGLAFALCENQVTALVDVEGSWRPLVTERAEVARLLDLRHEDRLARLASVWGGRDVRLGSVRAGIFGMTGLRDPHLVQHADGTPFERDGRRFLTWTCAGLGFFQQAHWTVWSFDPADPSDMRLESQLFTRRDGLVLGDHAGQLVRDGDRWLVATSSWGDFEPGSIHVRHTETDADLLHGVHLLETRRTPLPTEHGSWDPGFTRADGRWQVGFVESPSQEPFDFHPALVATDARAWHEALSPVAARTELHQCEGPVLVTVEGTTWLLASDGDARNYPVLDLAGRRVGRLDAPYPTNIPHPQLVPDPAGGWWLVTFDGSQFAEKVMGYGGHGDVVLMHTT